MAADLPDFEVESPPCKKFKSGGSSTANGADHWLQDPLTNTQQHRFWWIVISDEKFPLNIPVEELINNLKRKNSENLLQAAETVNKKKQTVLKVWVRSRKLFNIARDIINKHITLDASKWDAINAAVAPIRATVEAKLNKDLGVLQVKSNVYCINDFLKNEHYFDGKWCDVDKAWNLPHTDDTFNTIRMKLVKLCDTYGFEHNIQQAGQAGLTPQCTRACLQPIDRAPRAYACVHQKACTLLDHVGLDPGFRGDPGSCSHCVSKFGLCESLPGWGCACPRSRYGCASSPTRLRLLVRLPGQHLSH